MDWLRSEDLNEEKTYRPHSSFYQYWRGGVRESAESVPLGMILAVSERFHPELFAHNDALLRNVPDEEDDEEDDDDKEDSDEPQNDEGYSE